MYKDHIQYRYNRHLPWAPLSDYVHPRQITHATLQAWLHQYTHTQISLKTDKMPHKLIIDKRLGSLNNNMMCLFV